MTLGILELKYYGGHRFGNGEVEQKGAWFAGAGEMINKTTTDWVA